jgi:hypothetical protein
LNGNLISEVLSSTNFNNDNTAPLTIGNSGGFEPFYGSLDDIAIYNRALSQQEITALYQGANTTANCLDIPSNLQQGLVGYWPFCGNALDESGNGNHGTVNGAILTTDRFGNDGSAFQFSDDDISVPHNPVFGISQNDQKTISLWAKVTGTQSCQHLMGKRPNPGVQYNWQIHFNYPF